MTLIETPTAFHTKYTGTFKTYTQTKFHVPSSGSLIFLVRAKVKTVTKNIKENKIINIIIFIT